MKLFSSIWIPVRSWTALHQKSEGDSIWLPCKRLSKSVPSGKNPLRNHWFWAPRRPGVTPLRDPVPKKNVFFGWFFGHACYRRRYVKLPRICFCCNVEKVCACLTYKGATCGLLRDLLCKDLDQKFSSENTNKPKKCKLLQGNRSYSFCLRFHGPCQNIWFAT